MAAKASAAAHRHADAAAKALSRRYAAIVAEAARVFDKELTPPQRMMIAEEIVVARAAELRLAYPNVIGVSFGFKRVVNREKRQHEIKQKPCVRFLVRHKWPKGTKARGKKSAIPSRLLAMVTIGDRRVLCAVPTDVEDRRMYAHVVPHVAQVTAKWSDATSSGVLACALTRDRFPEKTFALSCRHLVSLSERYFNGSVSGATVYLGTGTDGTVLGQGANARGSLGVGISFDAQLVEIEPTDAALEALRTSLAGMVLAGYAATVHELPADYCILTPEGTIKATFVDAIPNRAMYSIAGVRITHEWLIQSEPERPTIGGHSGSPVVTLDGATFLGMHVAGGDGKDENGYYVKAAFMIPAWALFTPANYQNVQATERWNLTAP